MHGEHPTSPVGAASDPKTLRRPLLWSPLPSSHHQERVARYWCWFFLDSHFLLLYHPTALGQLQTQVTTDHRQRQTWDAANLLFLRRLLGTRSPTSHGQMPDKLRPGNFRVFRELPMF